MSELPSRTGRRNGALRTRPTIRDVAKLAKVSIGTVSKALNNNGSLRPDTRERVIKAAAKIGFQPNDLAQSLHRGQSFTVGMISNDSFGRFTMPIMEGLEARLADQRIAVFMCNATDDPARERQHLEQLMGKRVDGLVVTARRADRRHRIDLGQATLPIVYVFSQADDPDALSLLPDDEGGAKLATEHLISIGRRRLAHVTGPERFEAVLLRRSGFRKALTASRLKEVTGFYMSGEWSEAWGRQAVEQLFADRTNAPDGIVCGNDQIGRGAIDALRDLGISVPDEVAVIGFDNWQVMAEAARPPLSSIDMNLRDLGREAGLRLIEMISGKHQSGVVRLPCSLVVRGSTVAQAGGKPHA